MRNPSRHGLPRLPRRRPTWKRAGTWTLRKIGRGVYYSSLLALGITAALTAASGVNGNARILLATGTAAAVIYVAAWLLPVVGMVVARIGSMIIQRWRWRRG